MGTIRDYSALAKDILAQVGGEENLVSFSRCATRLRLVLKHIPESATEQVKKLTGVITVVISAGQFQVVVGTHVAEVYSAFSALVNNDNLQTNPAGKNARWMRLLLPCRLFLLRLFMFLLLPGYCKG